MCHAFHVTQHCHSSAVYCSCTWTASAVVFTSGNERSFWVSELGRPWTLNVGEVRRPRERNALQLQKTQQIEKAPANHQFDRRLCKCSQHKQIKKHCKCSQHKQIHLICSAFLFWLCCEHLQRVCCQINESFFLICRCFFYFAARWALSATVGKRET